jgi:hypothetical protein
MTKALIFPKTDAISRKRNVLSGPFSREDVRPRPQLAGDYQHNIFMAFLFVAGLARAILVAAPSARMVNKECKAERSRIARQQATPST